MKRMHIKRGTSRSFGRLGPVSVDLTGEDFVVVSGPNETGKSTLADLISWVLAGRRQGSDAGHRFANFRNRPAGTTSVSIGGQVEGTIDNQDFTINRDFTIRTAVKGREPAAVQPTIYLDEIGRAHV